MLHHEALLCSPRAQLCDDFLRHLRDLFNGVALLAQPPRQCWEVAQLCEILRIAPPLVRAGSLVRTALKELFSNWREAGGSCRTELEQALVEETSLPLKTVCA